MGIVGGASNGDIRSRTGVTIAYPNIPLDDASHRVEDVPIIEFCHKGDSASYFTVSRKVLFKVWTYPEKTKMCRYSGGGQAWFKHLCSWSHHRQVTVFAGRLSKNRLWTFENHGRI